MKRTTFPRLFVLAVALFASVSVWAQDPVRVVLRGHDPVAYFTDGKPVVGDPQFRYDWDEGRYYFASAQHRDMFKADPERYAPQFGGYCTGSMAGGNTREGNPDAWVIRDGKLFVFGATKWSEVAQKDPAYLPAKVPAAAKNWTEKKSQKTS
jgi:YHS domain-containing protein